MTEEKRALEASVPETESMIDSSSAQEGAPRKRGPRGWARLCAAATDPRVRVWGAPVARGAGILAVLGCVAFLGTQAKETEKYGPQMDFSAPPATPAQPWEPAPSPAEEHVHAQTEEAIPPPCVKEAEPPQAKGTTEDGKIILNEASKAEFTQLPGVGDSRAEAIVKLRERLGKFRKVADLLRVRGIGWKTLQTMKDQIVVDRPVKKETKENAEAESAPQAKSGGSEKGAPS